MGATLRPMASRCDWSVQRSTVPAAVRGRRVGSLVQQPTAAMTVAFRWPCGRTAIRSYPTRRSVLGRVSQAG